MYSCRDSCTSIVRLFVCWMLGVETVLPCYLHSGGFLFRKNSYLYHCHFEHCVQNWGEKNFFKSSQKWSLQYSMDFKKINSQIIFPLKEEAGEWMGPFDAEFFLLYRYSCLCYRTRVSWEDTKCLQSWHLSFFENKVPGNNCSLALN